MEPEQQAMKTPPTAAPHPPKQLRRSSLKLASSCLKKYQNQQLPKNSLSPFPPATINNSSKRKALKKSSNTLRRRSSLGYISGVNTAKGNSKRGHSDIALGSSTASSGISHMKKVGSKQKKMGRSISFDVRPPRVHGVKTSKNNLNSNGQRRLATKMDCSSPTNVDMVDEDSSSGQNESWYSKEEYSNIIKEQMGNIAIMRYLRANGTNESELDPELYCERGLESYQSKEKRNEIDVKRRLHRFSVIREQARQSILGAKDPELLRVTAASQSEGSLRKAQLRAALDQHEVKGEQPLTEQEKLKVAMEQHQKIIQVQQMQDLQDMVTNQHLDQEPLQEDPAPVPTAIEDATNGIMTLASLWAQDKPSAATHELNATGSGMSLLGSSKVTHSPRATSKSAAAHDFWKKATSSKEVNGMSGSRFPHNSFFNQDTPMAYGSSSSMPSQAIQNAFCSSFAHRSADMQFPQHQNHISQPSFELNNNTASVASIMPTASALAAMNIHGTHHQTRQQQHQQQQSYQNHVLPYASLLEKIPK